MKRILFSLLLLLILVGCGSSQEKSAITELDASTQRWISRRSLDKEKYVADSLMRAAFERRPMWDTYYDNMSFEQAYLQVRRSVGKCGFFHYKGLPYCTFSKSEWDSFSHEERIVVTKAAEQRYYARSLVKSFFMRYGEITAYREVYFTNEEGVFASYQVSALQNDKKRTAFDLDTFVIDLQRPRFKYYSTMWERNPDPRDYKGRMERGADAEYYRKWINCSDRSFDDISVLVLELQKTLNPKLMATANSICMK